MNTVKIGEPVPVGYTDRYQMATISIMQDDVEESPETKEKIKQWTEYCRYLSDWAFGHSCPYECYGMTPASFDEWLSNEWLEHEEEAV